MSDFLARMTELNQLIAPLAEADVLPFLTARKAEPTLTVVQFAERRAVAKFAEQNPPAPAEPDPKDLAINALADALVSMAAAPVNVAVDVNQVGGGKVKFTRDRQGNIVGAETSPVAPVEQPHA